MVFAYVSMVSMADAHYKSHHSAAKVILKSIPAHIKGGLRQ